MEDQHIQIGPGSLRAALTPDTINLEKRTVDVTFSTGAAVLRSDMWSGQKWNEVLSLKRGAVRLDRLNSGAPFLDTHSAYDLSSVLGVVVPGSARISEGVGKATIRFSKRDAVEPVWQDIRDGIIQNVSVGYRVHKFEEDTGNESKIPTRTATDWEPFELSAVPMGADAGAKVRSADKQSMMNECLVQRGATPREGEPTMEPEKTVTETPAVRTEEVVVPGTAITERDEAAKAERERVQGIIKACRAAKLPPSHADKLIAEGVTLLQAQTRILDMLEKVGLSGPNDVPSGRGGASVIGPDPLETVWRGIQGALLHRIDPANHKLDDNSRQYRMHSLLRAAEECLEQRGIRTRGYSKMEIAGAALGLQVRSGLHTTSDFANILADVANKTLRSAYDAAPQTFATIARRIPMPDFKPVKRNQLGEAPALEKVLEHGEFTRGTIGEGKEQFQLATYGRIFGITRQALVNDDLDAFGRLTTMFGRAARNLESDVVWYQWLKNANMADGNPIFGSAHNNVAGANAIDVTRLGEGRAALRKQTGLDGVTYLNIVARYLVVPPSIETVADQYTTQITPAVGSNVNPFSGRLTVISEPRLEGGVTLDGDLAAGSASKWYLAADPTQIDIIEWGYLDGQEGPVVESRVSFEVDGLEVKCRHDFAAKVIDYRGVFGNGSF